MAIGDAATIIPSYDEITLCNPAFKTLRNMINAWLIEVSVYKNIFADYQLIHFYRYVTIHSPLSIILFNYILFSYTNIYVHIRMIADG